MNRASTTAITYPGTSPDPIVVDNDEDDRVVEHNIDDEDNSDSSDSEEKDDNDNDDGEGKGDGVIVIMSFIYSYLLINLKKVNVEYVQVYTIL